MNMQQLELGAEENNMLALDGGRGVVVRTVDAKHVGEPA